MRQPAASSLAHCFLSSSIVGHPILFTAVPVAKLGGDASYSILQPQHFSCCIILATVARSYLSFEANDTMSTKQTTTELTLCVGSAFI